MIQYRYDIRDRKVGKTNQASRRYNRIRVMLVLCLCAWQSLSAAIVMETPPIEVKVSVTDKIEERNNTPSTSLLLPLCSIVITAKHHGRGYLHITHTALINGVEEVPYQLFCDNRVMILPDVLSYECSPFIPLTIPMTTLSVMLAMPLRVERSFYTSMIFLHLKLEA